MDIGMMIRPARTRAGSGMACDTDFVVRVAA